MTSPTLAARVLPMMMVILSTALEQTQLPIPGHHAEFTAVVLLARW
jgi:hypothetical protein